MKHFSTLNFFAALCLIFLVQSAKAGQETHGGGGIVCEDANGKILSIELFEYAELRISGDPKGIKTDLGDQTLSVLDKVLLALSRLESIDKVAFKRYTQRSKTFFEETAFVDSKQIEAVNDQGEQINVPLEKGCYKAQLAVQFSNPQTFGNRYWIDAKLWASANSDTRAGLILHEIIYGDVIPHGVKESTGVRWFNNILSTMHLECTFDCPPTWKKSQKLRDGALYLRALKDLELYFPLSHEHSVRINDIDYWPDDLVFGAYSTVLQGSLTEDLFTIIRGQKIKFLNNSLINYYYAPTVWSIDNPLKVSSGTVEGDYYFHSTQGNLIHLSGINPISLTLDGFLISK